MKRHQMVLITGTAFMLLAGCQKTPEPKTPSPVALTPSGGESVALPPDKLPPSDASLPVVGAGAGVQESGKADTQSQANPAPLQGVQEKSAMPLTGQANNHSEPTVLDEKK